MKFDIKKIIIGGLAIYGAIKVVQKVVNEVRMPNPTESIKPIADHDSEEPENTVIEDITIGTPGPYNEPTRLRDYFYVEFKGRKLANDFMDFLKNRKKYYEVVSGKRVTRKLPNHFTLDECMIMNCTTGGFCKVRNCMCEKDNCPILRGVQTEITLSKMKGD